MTLFLLRRARNNFAYHSIYCGYAELNLLPSFCQMMKLKQFSSMSFIQEKTRGKVETGHDGWGQGFPCKASRSYFLGSGNLAKGELEDCDWYVLGFLVRCFLKVQIDLGFDLWHGRGHWIGLHYRGPDIWINFINFLPTFSTFISL